MAKQDNLELELIEANDDDKKLTITVSFKKNTQDKALYSFALRKAIEYGGQSAYLKHILRKEYNKHI